MAKCYISTAIPYVNGNPHIGHAMDYVLADTYARYRRLCGDEVRMSAGTDEHGNKVFSYAQKNNMDVLEYAKANSDKFRNFIDTLGITYTDFIRTTDADHERRVQEIWKKLEPHIYSANYDGWYCEGCERFVTQTEYEENKGCCPDHQKPYERLSEKNYYLRLDDFREEIREAIETDKMRIVPESRKKAVLNLLADAPDISISRPKKKLSWGVEVPGDPEQVMYVWVDALSNYITVLGYPEEDISEWWPAELQMIGKDILRFHAIIWPAILIGLDLPLPKNIVAHGYVLADGQKMSKSIGNVIDPMEVIEKHGMDAFRYYFLAYTENGSDVDFTWDRFETAYNSELANDLGNLVQRLATMCKKNGIHAEGEVGEVWIDEYRELMADFEFSKMIHKIWERIRGLNKAIDDEKPWELAKAGETEKLEKVLGGMVKEIREIAELLKAFLPETAEKIAAVFAGEIAPPEVPLFPKERS